MPTTACLRRSGLNYVSRRDVLEHLLLQREIGHKATQPSVLALQLLQAFGLLKLQAPILPAPAIITLLGDAGLLTGKRQALSLGELHLNLTQHGDDLLGAEPLPSGHLRLLSFQVNPLNQPSINPVQKEPVRSPYERGERRTNVITLHRRGSDLVLRVDYARWGQTPEDLRHLAV